MAKNDSDGVTISLRGGKGADWKWDGKGDAVAAVKAELRKAAPEALPLEVAAVRGKHTLSVRHGGGEESIGAIAVGLRNWIAAHAE